MKKIIMYGMAAVIAVSGFLGTVIAAPHQAKADTSWQPEVLISSAQVRFEAQATGYDSATNKYKYKFSWLMPKYRTYSFTIDGKMYQSSVTQNGAIETPFWFSPDITYTINVYPSANARGASIGQGSFKAPSAKSSSESKLTIEDEYEILIEELYTLPEYKSKNVKSPVDLAAIVTLMTESFSIEEYTDLRPYLSKRSVEVFDQLPLLLEEMQNSPSTTVDLTNYSRNAIKIVSSKQYAYITQTYKDKETKKKHRSDMVFVKEDGQWKYDYLQTFRSVFEKLGVM